jgi:hypothetical protein
LLVAFRGRAICSNCQITPCAPATRFRCDEPFNTVIDATLGFCGDCAEFWKKTPSVVYGNYLYSDDSSICGAAALDQLTVFLVQPDDVVDTFASRPAVGSLPGSLERLPPFSGSHKGFFLVPPVAASFVLLSASFDSLSLDNAIKFS